MLAFPLTVIVACGWGVHPPRTNVVTEDGID